MGEGTKKSKLFCNFSCFWKRKYDFNNKGIVILLCFTSLFLEKNQEYEASSLFVEKHSGGDLVN